MSKRSSTIVIRNPAYRKKPMIVHQRWAVQPRVQPPRRPLNARIGGFLGIEKKFIDGTIALTNISTTWTGAEIDPTTLVSLTAVAQGDGESQRDGRQYKVQGIQVRGQISFGAVEADALPQGDFPVRIIMVHDKQTNGAALNAEDVMVLSGVGDDVNTFRNLQFVKRFQILREKTLVLKRTNAVNEGAVNSFASGACVQNFKMSYKFKKDNGLQVNMSGTTGVIGNVTDNSVHMIAVTNISGGGDGPRIKYQFRTRFIG